MLVKLQFFFLALSSATYKKATKGTLKYINI